MEATIHLGVNVHVEVHDADTGELLHEQDVHNLVVNAGLNLIRDLLDGDAPAGLTYFAVGTSATAASAAQTTLVAETFRAAVTSRTSDAQKLTVKYYLPSGSGNGATLAEVGLFNHVSAGTMFARAVLSSTIAKTSAITVTFTWDINLAAA